MTTYYQCELSQGSGQCAGYIEERHAKLGSMVRVMGAGFDGLWRVDAVAFSGVPEDKIRQDQRINRKTFTSIAE